MLPADAPRALEAAWLAGYQARGARDIMAIEADHGGPMAASFRHMAQDYRDAVNSEAQDAANSGKDTLVTMQVLLADTAAQLAAAEAEIVRLMAPDSG